MKLQIALDLDSADKAVAMAAQVYGLVDIIEPVSYTHLTLPTKA